MLYSVYFTSDFIWSPPRSIDHHTLMNKWTACCALIYPDLFIANKAKNTSIIHVVPNLRVPNSTNQWEINERL